MSINSNNGAHKSLKESDDYSNAKSELLSTEVNEIIGSVPNRLIRYGSVSILAVIVCLIVGSTLIRYPDTLPAEILITTTSPPVKIVSGSNGELSKIFVQDGQAVIKNDVLAVISNTSAYEDILLLKNIINDSLGDINRIEKLTLGEMSTPALQFLDSRRKLNLFLGLSIYEDQKKTLTEQIEGYEILKKDQLDQEHLLKQDVELTRVDFERSKALTKEGVLAPQQFEAKEKEFLSSKRQLSVNKQAISSTNLSIRGLQRDISENDLKEKEEQFKLEQSADQNFLALKAAILLWEKKYLIKSPTSGTVSFTSNWTNGEYVEQATPVFWILSQSSTIIGQVKLPLQKSSKVKVGQMVYIKVDNYQFEEFGMMIGRIKSKSPLPNDKYYLVDVEFPEGLLTTYNKRLDFYDHMQGTASIVTEELSLFERIFYQFRKIYHNR